MTILSSSNLICRRVFETHRLVKDNPPQFYDANKQIVFSIACPPGCVHGGQLVFSRWHQMPLPSTPSKSSTKFEARPNLFGYERAPQSSSVVEWYLNFAHQHLFCAYGGSLFAQDEMQVAEHPALASLREALLESDIDPLTVEHGDPTPILIRGVERRCKVATDRNASEGRPMGLYGNNFALAPPDAIKQATQPIMPPTITNLIAMEAPDGGQGKYRLDEIAYILSMAFTGFSAAVAESRQEKPDRPEVVVHTGFWGCGAYGGNRVLMAFLQLLAAYLSHIDRLVFHAVGESGLNDFHAARQIFENADICGQTPARISSVLEQIEAMEFQWGKSDGN